MSVCLQYTDVYGTVLTEDPSWDGGARSVVEYEGDCFFGFEVTGASVGVILGLNSNNEGQHYLEIEHGFYFTRSFVDIIENGARTSGIGPLAYVEGTRFYLVRLGSEVLYCLRPQGTATETYFLDPRYPGIHLPGTILYVSQIASYGTVFLDASMYSTFDKVINETSGVTWYEGIEGVILGATAGAMFIDMPFALVAAESGINTFSFVELPFSITANGVSAQGINAELPFDVLAADTALNSIIRGKLPFSVYVDGSGSGVYTTLSGISVPLLFTLNAITHENNTGANLELPFVSAVYGSERGAPVSKGAYVELPFTGFATGTASGETAYKAGAYVELPLNVFATGTASGETAYKAGAYVELPFTGFATSSGDTDVIPVGGVYGELPFFATGFITAQLDNKFFIRLTFNPFDIPGPIDATDVTEVFYALTAPIVGNYTNKFRDRVRATASTETFVTYTVSLAEAVYAAAEQRGDLIVAVAEDISASENLSIIQIIKIAEELLAAGSVETLYEAIVTVLAAITITDAKVTGGSIEGASAGVGVNAFGPPSVDFFFTGWWPAGTIIELEYTTDVGPGFISYTLQQPMDAGDTMVAFAAALDAQPLVNASISGGSVQMTAQSPATTVYI